MSTSFTITSEYNGQVFQDAANKGDVKTYSIDLSPWAEDNHNISACTWSVKSGNATISNEALTSNVATANVNFAEAGGNLIKIVAATASTDQIVVYIDAISHDPNAQTDDYGIRLT